MTQGIHHITAIASDGVRTADFYARVLGLRLVKKTVNQDDVGTYHLFFGDAEGQPGMDLTFFIFRPPFPGKRGNGQVTTISLAVPENSFPFWEERFNRERVAHGTIAERFGRKRLPFFDTDNQALELVGVPDVDDGADVWTTPAVSRERAVRSFYGATLSVEALSSVEPVLTGAFGYTPTATAGEIREYAVPGSLRAGVLEVHTQPRAGFGITATGTVHHIAFRARDAAHQQELRQAVADLGLYPTEVIDRFYFRSVYFRTPAGILFEIATDGPGFTADEPVAALGHSLALPPFLEPQRQSIEANLPAIVFPEITAA